MKVWVAQLKCLNGHAILAVAGEFENPADANGLHLQLVRKFVDWVAKGIIYRQCGLCGSTDLHSDLNPTKFATIAEAEASMSPQQ